MKRIVQVVAAAGLASLMIAGAEAVVAYPGPSSAASSFFKMASLTYAPFALGAAAALFAAFGRRGLDLWLPFFAGLLRLLQCLALDLAANAWTCVALGLVVIVAVFGARKAADAIGSSPPFLFGLTVGMVIPILAARLIALRLTTLMDSRDRAMALGTGIGLVGFVALRSVVARWRKIGPVFLLGPIVSLWIWWRLGTSVVLGPGNAGASDANAPDIVLIVLDSVRAQELRSYGSSRNTMPNLERFAAESTVFQRAWTNGSWTLPAHASLFSGLNPTEHRYDTGFDGPSRLDPKGFLAARLHDQGYAAAAVVANVGAFSRQDPILRGFESIDADPLRPSAFKPWLFDLMRWFPKVQWLGPARRAFPAPSMRASWAIEHAARFWSKPETRPRFLFVNLMEAHLPWIPESEDLGRFGPRGLETESDQVGILEKDLQSGRPTTVETQTLRDRYDEVLVSLDRSLGRLLKIVTEPAGRSMIIVITSDHGEAFGEHGRFGHRSSLDEAVTRIPLIVRASSLRAGPRTESVQLSDLFGFLATASGLAPEARRGALPFGQRKFVIIEHRPGTQAPLPASYPRGDLSALIDWPYKYVDGPLTPAGLFDLSTDPWEMKNLAETDPMRAASMKGILRERSGAASGSPPMDARALGRLKALGYVR
ncbi:MAG: sulfatase-like hydrolase/transferase [Vicinamibacteria bacterium]